MLSDCLMSVLHYRIQKAPSDQSEAMPAHSRAGQSLPSRDGCAGPDAPQGTVGLLLLTRVQIADHKIPQIPFPELLPSPSSSSLYTQSGLSQPKCRISHFLLLKLHVIGDIPALNLSRTFCNSFLQSSGNSSALWKSHFIEQILRGSALIYV